MPLRCIDPIDDDRGILAFDLADEDWKALADRNRQERFLRMPCCDAEVVLRTSPQGTRHFVHKACPEDCPARDETEHHIRLKTLAVERARLAGWDADCEVTGETPSGERWTADVLASNGDRTIAIEIQWSSQTHEETRRRQRRYAESGVRCLWLMRATAALRFDDRDLPLVEVRRDQDHEEYRVVLGDKSKMDATDFLDVLFTTRRFKYGHPENRARFGKTAMVQLRGAPTVCRYEDCRAPLNVVLKASVTSGTGICALVAGLPRQLSPPRTYVVHMEDVGAAALETLTPHLHGLNIGAIKPRRHYYRSGQARDSTVIGASNGCPKCDRIFTAMNSDEWLELVRQIGVLGTFLVPVEPWRKLLLRPRTRSWRVWHIGAT